MLKVTVITVCFNSEKTIEHTIQSVLSQQYENIEYIVIDGQSTDGTLDIVAKYKNKITHIISEPDLGIYDAMNKAIKLASGDVVGMLNSDDFFYDDRVIERIASPFSEQPIDAAFGDLIYVDPVDTNKIVRKWKSGNHSPGAFQRGWSPAHPTLYLRKSVYEKHGVFDLSMGTAADYEFMLRVFEKFAIKSAYIPELLVKMRAGGVSNGNIKSVWLAHKNILLAFEKNGIEINTVLHTMQRVGPKLIDAIVHKIKNLF